jgi:hypothetical protein
VKSKLFDVRPGERFVLAVFIFIIAANAIALEGAYVLATSGFLKNLTVEQFPLLSIVDMLVLLAVSGFYTLIIDRFSPVRFVQGVLLVLAGLFVVLRFMIVLGMPDWLTYPGLYLLAEQQYTLFPVAFWLLASVPLDVAQSKRLFPLIAIGSLIGQILGSGLAGISGRLLASWGASGAELLSINAGLLVLAFLVLTQASGRLTRQRETEQKAIRLREILTTGLDFVRNVPSFRYLAYSMFAVGFALIIIEYEFLAVSDAAITDSTSYQLFYGVYRAILTLSSLVVQGLIAARLLTRTGLKNTFMILPISLVAAALWMLAVPGLIGAALGRLVARLVRNTIDRPTHQTFQGLIPDERRGRVSTFMDSYLYVIGNLIGSVVLAAILIAAARNPNTASNSHIIFMGLALLAAIFAVIAIRKMRSVYDESLLDWRLARRRRRGSNFVSSRLDQLIEAEDN